MKGDLMQRLAELGTWILQRFMNQDATTQLPETLTPGEAHYETSTRVRSSSIFIDKDGDVYVADSEIGRGIAGIVRTMKQTETEPRRAKPDLVVKKNLNSAGKAINLKRAKEFLCLVYPELAEYVHVFNEDDPTKTRLVMPKMGEKTLGKILYERGRSLNNRYAHYVKALQTLISLREERGIYHNDAHTGNILFDNQGRCFLIDAELFSQRTRESPYRTTDNGNPPIFNRS